FFFQAEDGIRDFHVTGVQTCALPISCGRPGRRRMRWSTHPLTEALMPHLSIAPILLPLLAACILLFLSERRQRAKAAVSLFATRSEERRVGKKCSSRWAPKRYRKQHE